MHTVCQYVLALVKDNKPQDLHRTANQLLVLHIQLLQQKNLWGVAGGSIHIGTSSLKLSCTCGRAVEIKQTQGENMKDSPHPPCLSPISSFLWRVCYFHLGTRHSPPPSSPVLLFQDPWAVLGGAFTKGFLFIDFLGKLILIANTWGLFSRSPLSAAAVSVTPCHISPLRTSGLFSRAIGIRTDESLSRSQGDNLLSFLICITLFKI